jgi:hypothetical protein
MKSAFLFIFTIFLPLSLVANTVTITSQNGRVKSINIINYKGLQYSDFEYTSSCVVGDYKYDSNAISFDNKQLKANAGDNFISLSVYSQTVTEPLSAPVMLFSNRICVPIRDYLYALDSLGVCKVLFSNNDLFKIADYQIFRSVPIITNITNKYNLAYFQQVYDEVNSKTFSNHKKTISRTNNAGKTLELLKNAMREDKPGSPQLPAKKEDYYDLPSGLNRNAILKRKR